MEKFDIELELIAQMDRIDDLSAQTDDEVLKQHIIDIVDYIGAKLLKIKQEV